MRILLTNDDGIDAPGLAALERALAGLGELWVVAPQKEHSAQSHAFTMHKPLRARPQGERRFACSGTPADCSYLGSHGLLPEPPDLVVSGINRGANLGYDVHYSGTVAAAREAVLHGIPAVAISLNLTGFERAPEWATAEAVARRVVEGVIADGLEPGILLNVNVPNVAADALKGLRVAPIGARSYHETVARRDDPWGRPYFWIGGLHKAFDQDPDTDGRLCELGWATITPLEVNPTADRALPGLRARFEGP